MRKQKSRNFAGCWACRYKKRKCDEMKPKCTLCTKHDDECSYDVKLFWVDSNIYFLVNDNVFKSRSETNSDYYCQNGEVMHKRERISKQKFKKMTNYKNDTDSVDCESNDNRNFTISIRRFKIYNNAVDSVFGRRTQRNYYKINVERTLDRLLGNLEASLLKGEVSGAQGPFTAFRNQNISRVNTIDIDKRYCEDDKLNCNNTALIVKLTQQNEHINSFVDNILSEVIWLNSKRNMLLYNLNFSSWFSQYAKEVIYANYELLKILHNVIEYSVERTMSFVSEMEHMPCINDIHSKTMLFTVLAIKFHKNSKITNILLTKFEGWIIHINEISIAMYPMINFIVGYSNNLKVMYHSYMLLNEILLDFKFKENKLASIESLWQTGLGTKLLLLITKKLTQIWTDKLLQQICTEEDSTNAYSQMNLWQSELQINEKIYEESQFELRNDFEGIIS